MSATSSHIKKLSEAVSKVQKVVGVMPDFEDALSLLLDLSSAAYRIDDVLDALEHEDGPGRRPMIETSPGTAAMHVHRGLRAASRPIMDELLRLESAEDDTVAANAEQQVSSLSLAIQRVEDELRDAARFLQSNGVDRVATYNSMLVERALP